MCILVVQSYLFHLDEARGLSGEEAIDRSFRPSSRCQGKQVLASKPTYKYSQIEVCLCSKSHMFKPSRHLPLLMSMASRQPSCTIFNILPSCHTFTRSLLPYSYLNPLSRAPDPNTSTSFWCFTPPNPALSIGLPIPQPAFLP